MLETEERHIWSPGWKGPLEEEMATHSSILAWKVPWTEELVGYSPWGLRALDTTKRARARAYTHTHTHTCTHGHVSINLYLQKRKWSESHSVMSDSLWPCGLYSPWNSLQVRILEWVASSFSNVHKQPIFITNILRISRLLDGLQWYKYIQFWVDQFE